MRGGVIILVLAALTTGCATRPGPVAAPPLDDGPLATLSGRARSLATDAAPLRAAFAEAPPPVDPWYLSRSDARPATTVGVRGPALLYAETLTVDRQRIIHGEPHNYLNSTTYRGRTIEAVR